MSVTRDLDEELEVKRHRIHLLRIAYDTVKLVLMITTAAITLYLLTNIQELTAGNQQIQLRLQDCTTPGGKCYEESAKRTGVAIVKINDIAKAANVCADLPGSITTDAMSKCIEDELKKAGK